MIDFSPGSWNLVYRMPDTMAEIPFRRSGAHDQERHGILLFFTYVNVPLLNANTTKTGFPKQPLTVPFSALSSLYKYLTGEVENEQGEPYFYRNVMKKVATKKKKKPPACSS